MSEPIFAWRPTQDAERVHAIHRSVLAGAPPGMVRPDPLAHFEAHMGRRGHTLGCHLDGGEMVAYGVLGLDSPTVTHLAGLLDADIGRFCVLDGAASLAPWRGYRLHYASIHARIRHALTLGRNVVGASVAPENIRSVRVLFHAGFIIREFAHLYGGLARLVVQRDLLAPAPVWRLASIVPLAHHEGHREALASGLCGYACEQNAKAEWQILYGTIETIGEIIGRNSL